MRLRGVSTRSKLEHDAPSLFSWLLISFVGQFGAWPTLDAFYTELFPTELRAFAGSAASIWRVPGVPQPVLGGILISHGGNISSAIPVLAVGPLAAIVIIAITFPETKGRDLEEINAEFDLKQNRRKVAV